MIVSLIPSEVLWEMVETLENGAFWEIFRPLGWGGGVLRKDCGNSFFLSDLLLLSLFHINSSVMT